MKPVLLKQVKKGEFFALTNNVKYNEDGEVLSKYVYVRDAYDRERVRSMRCTSLTMCATIVS